MYADLSESHNSRAIGDTTLATRIMAMHGTLNPFAPGQEDWTSYVERVPAHSMATTSFNDLVGKVRDFYTPKPSVIVQRFKFNSRIRAKEERTWLR